MSEAQQPLAEPVRFISSLERRARGEMMLPSEPALEPSAVLAGFQETFRRLGLNTELVLQVAAQTYALAEVLVAHGVIASEELDQCRQTLEDHLRETSDVDNVVQLAREPDKYSIEAGGAHVDCENRLPICHAACCRLRFALSQQDIDERVMQWEVGRPYLNRQRPDGYCVHCNESTNGCEVYDHRPGVCRRYDCRDDPRIWEDFERRIPNPKLVGLFPNG